MVASGYIWKPIDQDQGNETTYKLVDLHQSGAAAVSGTKDAGAGVAIVTRYPKPGSQLLSPNTQSSAASACQAAMTYSVSIGFNLACCQCSRHQDGFLIEEPACKLFGQSALRSVILGNH